MPNADDFVLTEYGAGDPAAHVAAITPSDTVDLPDFSRAILASADCTVKLTTVGGETDTAYPMQKGYNPIRVKRVFSTGTTLGGATLRALW